MAEPAPASPLPSAPEPEQAPAQSPALQRTADGRVIMRVGDELRTFTDEQAQAVVAEGRGLPATSGEVHESDLQRQFGEGIGTELRTAAEAGADVATLGGYSLVARTLGGEGAAEGLRERYVRNPGAKLAGEIGTLAALTLASGGTGALGTAARLTPGGAALRAGVSAERALAGSGALSEIGALTTAGTVEGGLFGLGQGVQEVALSERDTDLTAESVLAHLGRTTGEGAVFGLLGGAGGGLLSQGAKFGGAAVARRARQALERGEAGIAAKATTGAVGDTASGATAAARAADGTDPIRASMNAIDADARKPLQRLQDQASAAKRIEKQREVFVPGATADLTDIDVGTDLVMSQARKIKPSEAQRALDELPIANFDATRAAAVEMLDSLDAEVAGILGDELKKTALRGRGAAGLAKAVEAGKAARASLTGMTEGSTKLGQRIDPATAFNALNDYKRIIGQAAEHAVDSSAREPLDRFYHQWQQFLESTEHFGGMAKVNQGINPGWSRLLTARTVDSDLVSVAPRKSLSDPFRQGRQGDSAKAQALFDATGDVRGSTRVQNAREWLDAHEDFVRRARETYDLGPETRKQVAKVESAIARVRKQLDDAVKTHADAAAFREIGGPLNDIAGLSTAIKGAKAGLSALANVRDSVDNVAVQTARNDIAQRAARLESVRNAASTVGGAITNASRALVTGSATAVKQALPAAASVAQQSRLQRFEKAYRATTEFERDPQAAVRRTQKAQGDLARFAPKLAAAQATRQVALMQLLADKLPPPEPPSIYGDNPDVPRIPPAQQDEFLRYWRAANDPLSVIEDAAHGKLSPEGIEVLQTGYPELYGALQRSVLTTLEDSDKPPYETRLMLGQLLELPTDPGLEPEMLAALQQSAASVPAPSNEQGGLLAPSQRTAPETAGGQQTNTDRLQTGR